MYVATLTRPDITSIFNILEKRNESPTVTDWDANEKLISCLMTIVHLKFKIDRSKLPELTVYSDHNWTGETMDEKSTTKNLFKIGNNVIA